MASMKLSCSNIAQRVACRPLARPILSARHLRVRAQASGVEVTKAVAISSAAATLLYSGNALAAQELLNLADSDNRVAIIGTLFVPALAWVGFNMLQPLTGQINKMADEKKKMKYSIATAVGLGATAFMLMAGSADASEVAMLAERDSRIAIIGTLFVPALGWVGFNMLEPLSGQINKMADERDGSKRSIATAVGLGAAVSMLMAGSADAATQVATLAASDSRVAAIGTLIVPALGWVGFNMLEPLSGQMSKMANEKKGLKRSIATAVGLGTAASMLMAGSADAATQVATLAASDSRVAAIGTLIVPALGWVGFNMLEPISGQMSKMADERKGLKKSIATAVGLGTAASMLMAGSADAATQVATLAASDSRVAAIGTLIVPALGWVGFNMLEPLSGQMSKMADERKGLKKSIATAVGLGTAISMLVAGSADAATQVAMLAESDSRVAAIGTLIVPALGWVGFNMLEPLSGQFNKMQEDKKSMR